MKAQIKKRLKDAKKLTATDPEEASRLKALMRKFENDLADATDALKAATYIDNAHFELVGDENNPGLYEKMILASDESDALGLMDRFRMQVQSYKVLDNIKETLELGLSQEDLTKLSETEEYKKLQEAITSRDNALSRFFDVAGSMIAEKLATYRSQSAEDSINDHFAISIAHFESKIKETTEEMNKRAGEEGYSRSTYENKIKSYEKSLAIANEKRTELSVTPAQIIEELRQGPRDLSIFSFYAISATSSSDKILSLFAKMTKFRFDDGDMEAKRSAMRLQKAVDDFGGLSGVMKYVIGDNAESFYDRILETGEE
jgi:hypothetical protein